MPFDGTVFNEINEKIAMIDKIDRVLSDESKWCKYTLEDERGRMCLLGAMNKAISGNACGLAYDISPWLTAAFAEAIEPRREPRQRGGDGCDAWSIAVWNNGDETTFAHIKEVIATVRENLKTKARVAA